MATPISKGSLSPITAEIWQFLSPSSCPPCITIFFFLLFLRCLYVFFFFISHRPPPFSWFQAPSHSHPVIRIVTRSQKTIYIHFKRRGSAWWHLPEESCRVATSVQMLASERFVFFLPGLILILHVRILLLLCIQFGSQFNLFQCLKTDLSSMMKLLMEAMTGERCRCIKWFCTSHCTSNADTGSRVRNDLFLCTLLDEIGKILSK